MKFKSFFCIIILTVTVTLFAFDFIVEEPMCVNLPVIQGFWGVNAVHVALLEGPPQSVSFSVTGLPAGATASFTPASCNFDRPGKPKGYSSTSTFTITAGASTPIGTYPLQVVGTGGGKTHSANFTMTVSALTAASGKIYYVSTSGNDGNDGSNSSPFRTIQRGADVAQAGDVVVVKAGLYWERIVIKNSGLSGKPITFIGEPGAIIDGNQKITGWLPAPEIAAGVWKKSMNDIPFVPAAMAYQGKFALVFWWESVNGGGIMPKMTNPQGHPWWDVVGAYGYVADGHGDPTWYVPMYPNTHTVYARLKTGGSPDNEDVTWAEVDAPAISILGKNYITVRGFTIRNGFTQIAVNNGAIGTIIEHNLIRGGAYSLWVEGGAKQTVIRNNESTLNHYYGEVLPPAYTKDVGMELLNDLRHLGRHNKNCRIGLYGGISAIDVKIYQNHLFGDLAGILAVEPSGTYEIYNNYIHHMLDYTLELHVNRPSTFIVHDNLLYEMGLEGWRNDQTDNNATLYIYRNRFHQITRGSWCGSGGYPGCGVNDMEFGGSDAKQYWYHNSFLGGYAFCLSNYGGMGSGGLPNTWVVNNIISSAAPFLLWDDQAISGYEWGNPRWHFDYNWIGSWPGGEGIPSFVFANYSHNRSHPGLMMWDTLYPSFQLKATSDARLLGLDLSNAWTMDGVQHPALPGMTKGYFSGARPDLGVFQYSAPGIKDGKTQTEIKEGIFYGGFANPISAHAEIRYVLSKASEVQLKVCNQLGQLVRVLDQGKKSGGSHCVRWNGFDDNGKKLSNGIYFLKLQAGNREAMQRILIIR